MIDYVTNANNDDLYNYDTNYSVSNSDNNTKITLKTAYKQPNYNEWNNSNITMITTKKII